MKNFAPITYKRISHPDLTADNIIIQERTGELKLIDNELMTQSNYFLIDLFNTHYSFGYKFERNLLKPYMVNYMNNEGHLKPLIENECFYNALWHLRLIGASMQAGAIEKGVTLAKLYMEGGTKPHPLIKIAKQIL